ncbi:MAG: Benzylsuccinate CoA-transferase BbsF subunit [Pseudonocardiales bacterium]|nr:Benzylsuccinate CoA-transferase BbsF subunit [Pseudonocardiales bacterium]
MSESSAVPEGGRIFNGVKIWDVAWVGVGPLTTRYLADYGATVVHTETVKNPDVLRLAGPFRNGVKGIDNSHFFGGFNTSKLGLGLNYTAPRGKEIAHRLAVWADIVVESFSPGVMAKFGLTYDALREINPQLIMLSTSMNGQTGPRSKFAGFGTVMAAMAGFSEVTGWPDRNPGSPYGAYTDFVAQRLCATALIAALDHRRRTGHGQYIDLSQYEGSLQWNAPTMLDFAVNGRIATRMGNRHTSCAPHGIYPSQPEDGRERWVAIAVETDEEWRTLVELMGSPAWASDPIYATLRGRKQHEDQLDAHLSAWTAQQRNIETFYLLQPRVAAAPVNDARDVINDPQVRYRQYLRPLEHTVMGTTLYEGNQAEMSVTPAVMTKAAPCLGENTRDVLSGMLGYSDEEIDSLLADGSAEAYPVPDPFAPPA